MAVRASDTLKTEGIGVRVLNIHTIKPLDREAILAAAAQTRGIVTAEEHRLCGGLGGAVAELLAVEHPARMRMIGMPDAFAMVGPTVALRAKYGMSAAAIVDACRALLA
jgi:transketolase